MTARLETLVRETLADPRRRLEPGPELYDQVLRQARTQHRRAVARWTTLSAAAAAVTAVAVVAATAGPHTRTGPAATPAAPTQSPGLTTPVAGVTGAVADITRTADALFLVESSPDLVLRIDPATGRVTGDAPAPAGATGLAADPTTGRLWVWSSGGAPGHGTPAREYDLAGLTPRRDLSIPANDVYAAAMLAGTLWLTTANGLYRVPAGAPAAQLVAGADRAGFGVAADPTRNRLIVAGGRVQAIDAATSQVTDGPALDLLKPSVAVVSGQIWVGGYGSGDGTRLVRLDPGTLRPAGSSQANEEVGPGAILWPGGAVLWIRDGGDEGLSCVDPVGGRILQRWTEVQGPVTSTTGAALAAHNSVARWLTLNKDCVG